MLNSRKSRAVLGVAFALAVATSALAYWTQSGSGSGSASVGTTSGITVYQTSSNTGLYPGGSDKTLSGDFKNSNDSAVQVGNVSITGVTTDKAGCTAADFSTGGSAPVDASVPSGNHVGSWSGLTVAMKDTGVNQDACKGATVTIAYASN